MLTTRQIPGAALAACPVLPTATRADTAAPAGRSAAEAWDRTYDSGDMDTLGTLHAPDAQVIPKGAAISGPADIRTFFSGLTAKGVTIAGSRSSPRGTKATSSCCPCAGR